MTQFSESVIDALERAPRVVVPLVRDARPEILRRRPAPRKWSIHEHACHLAQVDALMLRRLDVMLSEDDPVVRSYDPGRDDPDDSLLHLDLETELSKYERDRISLVERLRRLSQEDWQRTARHDEYHSYSVGIMFRHLALHDFFHAYRIEELVLKS